MELSLPCHLLLVKTVFLTSFILPPTTCLTCLDGQNNEIDWYAVYKTPKLHSHKDWKLKEGLAYYYLDVLTPQWSLENNAINETGTPVYNTLQQIYKSAKSDSIMYIMYNDEPAPSGMECATSSSRGHTKGVLALDKDSGFLLSHSCPKFPPKRTMGFEWRSQDYAQNMLCITFSYSELGKIATQLLYNEPTVYDSNLPEDFEHDFPILAEIIKEGLPKGPPWFSVQTLTSAGGQSFKSFAKSRHFGADLYDGLIAPTLASDLYTETWLREKGTELNSNCTTQYKVYRVTGIQLPWNVTFREEKDHSKFAITKINSTSQDSLPWVCIGDINRMESQFHRGGGSTCLQNQHVWKAYRSTVLSYQKCPQTLRYKPELKHRLDVEWTWEYTETTFD